MTEKRPYSIFLICLRLPLLILWMIILPVPALIILVDSALFALCN